MNVKESQNRNKPKVCACCGKLETSNWVKHWEKWHKVVTKEKRIVLGKEEEPT